MTLNQQQYRYARYEHPHSDQYGVLILGALQEIETVEYFSRRFSEVLNLIVIEIPGTGLNPPISARYTVADQAQMLIDGLHHLGVTTFHLLTFSYGTSVCIEAYKLTDGVQSMSIACGADGIPDAGRKNTILMLSDSLRNPRTFAQTFIDSLTVEDDSIPRSKAIVRQIKRKVSQYSEDRLISFCENTLRLLGYNPSYNLSDIRVPCSVCVGDKDPYVTVDTARTLAQSIPGCSFSIIDNADHLIHVEQPEQTANLMIHIAEQFASEKQFEKIA